MSITTYGEISQRTAAYAATEMLKHAKPVVLLGMLGQSKPIPRNKAQTITFRRAIPFEPVTRPLVEGVTPTARVLRFEDVSATLDQYGDLVIITDRVSDLTEDPVLQVATEEAGQQAGASLEQLLYNTLKGGTTVFYANGVQRSQVNTPISLNKQRKVTKFLKAQKAQKFTKILDGSVKIGTRPIEASYIAVAHTNLESDIRNMPGFTPVAEYGSRSTISEHEIGAVEDVRYILSPDLDGFESAGGAPGGVVDSTNGTAADVFPILYFGMEAFGVTPLRNSREGGNRPITPTVLNPGTPSKSDPLGQRGYVGWKTYFAAVRLNENWMCRMEVAVSTL